MTARSSSLQVELETLRDVTYVLPRTSVAIPPSNADPIWDEMRVAVDGTIVLRAFDPGDDIVTGAPIPYVTKSGVPYVTKVAT